MRVRSVVVQFTPATQTRRDSFDESGLVWRHELGMARTGEKQATDYGEYSWRFGRACVVIGIVRSTTAAGEI